MYNNNTPYNHYLVDWINYHRCCCYTFIKLPVVVDPVDEIVVVGGAVVIHLFSYLW
jgi:hypothetical protein